MRKRPLIFITNDDGVRAKGLQKMIEVAREFGDVIAISSEKPQSGMAHAITMHKPLHLTTITKEAGVEVYAASGTPVDCVKLAFDHMLLDNYPDLTLSGINHGSNSAISVIYSGTMGAAIEASFYGKPAIGFSLLDHSPDADFTVAGIYVREIIGKVLATEIEMPMCLNVNIPAVAQSEIKGIRVCRQARGYWKESFIHRLDPRGKDYYWLTGDFYNVEPDSPDTDEWALVNNYVSVVPIQVDLTNHEQVEELGKIF